MIYLYYIYKMFKNYFLCFFKVIIHFQIGKIKKNELMREEKR